ncbi:AAA family ATPase [Phaeovibrio sulfidiphilus]|uniref:AAA family ATPase n=1 Tax=Phaeovibrio sulfidiphilus TaxID=1220600 RepID=A0A8J6YUT3_9PROT|nr:YhaN family protein [Phaeovibrio sulfidiphilus]MBE1236809.1 AAA family ATPase [Phaeovibrio sulfidiphilus]
MMRLRRLDLKRFGHFTDTHLEFGEAVPGTPDFHVVYGPNEAGKTTLMEGYLRLLYGFLAKNEPYDFRHQRPNLSVAGLLDINGQTLFLERSPRKGSPLLDERGAVVPEAVLGAVLGRLSRDDYRKLLCLDDATIETGGQEITNSQGEIGRLLFSAAAGISDLSTVLEDARKKADDLYRKGARLTRFAEVKKEFDDLRTRIQETDIPGEAWKARRQALDEARAEQASAEADRRALHQEKVHIEARLRALPVLERIDALERDLAPLALYPEALDVDPEELLDLLGERATLDDRAAQLARERARLEDEQAAVAAVPRAPGLAEDLAALQGVHGRVQAAQTDLPHREQERADRIAAMRQCVRDLGIGEDVDPQTLVVPALRLTELEQAREAVLTSRSDIARECGELEAQDRFLADLQRKIARLQDDGDRDGPEIAAVLERFDTQGLERDHAVAQKELASARARLGSALAALTRGRQVFDTVPDTAVTEAEVADLVSSIQSLDRKLADLQERRNDLRTECESLRARAEALKTTAGVVSDEEVLAARTTRDALWAAHRAALTADTAGTFHEAMQALDRLEGQQLARAAEAGSLREIRQDLREKEVRAAGLDRSLEQAGTERARLYTRLAGLLADAGLEAGLDAGTDGGLDPGAGSRSAGGLAPDGAVVWFRALDAAREAARTLDQVQEQHAPVFARARALMAELGADDTGPAETAALPDVLHRAGTIATRHTTRLRDVEQEQVRLRDNLEAREAQENRLSAARLREEEAVARWTSLVDGLFGSTLGAEALLRSLDPLRDLRECDGLLRETVQRIEAMARDREAFGQEVRALAGRYAVADTGTAQEIYAALEDRARESAAAEQKAAALEQSLAELRENGDDITRRRERLAARVAHLGALFPPAIPAATLEDVRAAVSATHRAIGMRQQKAELEREVCLGLGCTDLADARASLADARMSDLETRLLDSAAALDDADRRHTAAVEARVAAETALKAVTGEADVALLVERCKTLELELGDIAFDYLEWQIGLRLAHEAIRRYRDRHRSGMLEATERAFVELTNGAYSRLETVPDGGAEILMALDAAGTAKRAEDLSKGTRFQLYLALRAAAYEQMAAAGTVLPFFCDDIFETFDEGRTRAACQLMERIGRTGQAIYLTHHRHVVDLAQEVCGARVHIHTLPTAGLQPGA